MHDGQDVDLVAVCLAAVASETGYAVEDMEDDTLFQDLGVDSLMSIAIIDALSKVTGIDFPASFFTMHESVGSARRELQSWVQSNDSTAVGTSTPTSSIEPKESLTTQHEKMSPGLPSAESTISGRGEHHHPQPKEPEQPVVPPAKVAHRSERENSAPQAAAMNPLPSVKPTSTPEPASAEIEPKKYSSNVVLLQGRVSSGQRPLFLMTDGAGSATAYIHLPAFPAGMPVYALESPFLHCPEEYKVPISSIASMFVAGIWSIQPHGPYLLGGWSAGAVYAYEAARQLLEVNEKIISLILLDMRVPRPMPDALEPTMELLEQAGLVTWIRRSGKALAPLAPRLKQHLLSTVKQLMVFQPTPMDPERRPDHVAIIWARKGMSEVLGDGGALMGGDADPKVNEGKNIMEDESTGLESWFFAKRHAFGPNGWDQLVGGPVECFSIDADHFSLVTVPDVKATGEILKKLVAKCNNLDAGVTGSKF